MRSEEEMEGSDGTCEVTTDTTMLIQIEETICTIRKLPFVTVLAPVRAVGDRGRVNTERSSHARRSC